MSTAFDPMGAIQETTAGRRLFIGRAAPGPQQQILMAHYDISRMGAAIFLFAFAAQMEERQETLTDIAQRYRITGAPYRTLLSEYFTLVKKKMIVSIPYQKNASPLCCAVEPLLMKMLVQGDLGGDPFDPADPFCMIQAIADLWEQRDHNEITPSYFSDEAKRLLKKMSPENRLHELIVPFPFAEQIMFIIAAIDHIAAHRSGVDLREFAGNFFKVLRDRANFLRDVAQEKIEIIREGLILLNDRGSDPFSRSPEFTLSPTARMRLFGGKNTARREKVKIPAIFSHRRWRDKGPDLYFDDRL
ncbi:MAG TPA: hypothetical protein PKH10_09495, partial [bacterium]|nr:hypothetical protein [bacterium]